MESVDSGVLEITNWLNDAETLLKGFHLHGTKDTIQNQLDQHKVWDVAIEMLSTKISLKDIEAAVVSNSSFQTFFSRQLYFKSMLDTKNRVYQNLLRSSNDGENFDVKTVQVNIQDLNDRWILHLISNACTLYYAQLNPSSSVALSAFVSASLANNDNCCIVGSCPGYTHMSVECSGSKLITS